MEIVKLPPNKKIIIFDGVCNFCNEKVNFIIKNDKNDVFRFVALQSETGKKLMNYLGIDTSFDSIVLYQPGFAYFVKADAVFNIVKELTFPFKWLYVFSFFPSTITNLIYNYFAKNRYNWFGKNGTCMIPTNELSNKFL